MRDAGDAAVVGDPGACRGALAFLEAKVTQLAHRQDRLE